MATSAVWSLVVTVRLFRSSTLHAYGNQKFLITFQLVYVDDTSPFSFKQIK
uniref:Uncharacterized protein n=1 Tax=Arundo donax TaxID=35708 RepID=A0A0A9FT50_ARUDO